ncbi:hypothetical protein ACHAWF_016353, partial [Thalassiosira exigua]
ISGAEAPSPSPSPILSILNVVVDHVMLPPSPLEVEEYAHCEGRRREEKEEEGRREAGLEGGDGPSRRSESERSERSERLELPAPLPASPAEDVRVRVPVLRIFGPVLRGGTAREAFLPSDEGKTSGGPRRKAPQPPSGCLHVHGAYPYFLARPVVAGPDGSIRGRRDGGGDDDGSGRIDWDDAASVATIVEEVQCRLEASLRASLERRRDLDGAAESNGEGGGDGGSAARKKPEPTPLFVRQITVVRGRGFYTYCAGPPAPFLRVEYYDPGHRWRVKLAMERGLELGECCRPDPRRYDYDEMGEGARGDLLDGYGVGSGGAGGGEGGGGVRPLKFRCYEAHIPYTMQVFKASFDARIRLWTRPVSSDDRAHTSCPHPASPLTGWFRRRQGRSSLRKNEDVQRLTFRFARISQDCNLAGMKYVKVGGGRFRRPLPKSRRKRTRMEFLAGGRREGGGDDDDAYFLPGTVSDELLWPQREGEEATTRTDRHWLKKQTCCDVELDCTVRELLDVRDVMTELPSPLEERQKIHWRAVPSLREVWEQERERMSALLPPENDFLSCREEAEAVDSGASDDDDETDGESDDGIEGQGKRKSEKETTSTPPFTLNVKRGASRPGTRLAVRGMKRLFRTSVGLEADFRRALKDVAARHEASIDAEDRGLKGEEGPSPTRGEDAPGRGSSEAEESGFGESPAFRSRGDVLTPSTHEGIEALAALGGQFSQWADGGDATKGPDLHTPIARRLTAMKGYSATPLSQRDVQEEMEMLTFGEQVDAGDLVSRGGKAKGYLGNPSTLSRGEEDSEEDDDGFLAEEERLGEDGLERALTQLATQAIDANEESTTKVGTDILDSHSEIDNHHAPMLMPGESDQGDLLSDDDDAVEIQLYNNSSIAEEASDEKARFSADTPAVPQQETGLFVVETYGSSPRSISQEVLNDLSQKHRPKLPACMFVSEPRKATSLRFGDIIREAGSTPSKPWHAIPSSPLETCSPWFHFQWKGEGSFPVATIGSYLEPVKRPPSYAQVKSWVKARSKRPSSPIKQANVRMKKLKIGDGDRNGGSKAQSQPSYLTAYTQYSQIEESQETPDPLAGLGQQGCKVQVSSGGGLKTQINTSTTFTPLTMMSIEVHVQCRISTGKDRKDIAMVPDSSRDAVFAVVYIYGRDPGGGESIEILEKGCVLVSVESKVHLQSNAAPASHSKAFMGLSSDVTVERAKTERTLLQRVASILQNKDPDVLVSWDTQGAGVGYLVERGIAIGKPVDSNNDAAPSSGKIDLARLMGRTPRATSYDDSENHTAANNSSSTFGIEEESQQQKDDPQHWSGSGLGAEWDDRVGAGAAAASIAGRIVLCGWKICAEECKHPNASYQPAIVSAVLNKRIPWHDDLLLTKWYGANGGVERWRVINHRLAQAIANVLLFDALDVLGRAGEAARLSGVEFSQSLPGIRGSQYKVEGVLLRALQSVQSNERGDKKGFNQNRHLQGTSLTALTSSSESQSQSQSPWKLRRNLSKSKLDMALGVRDNQITPQDMGYFFYSPSKLDCSNQEALECQAMTLEPKSGFHFDPVVVCDFTALYPSLVIAYNLCYSTVAGKLDYHSTRQEMRRSGRTTSTIGPFHYAERRSATVIKHHMKSLIDSKGTEKQRPNHRKDRAYVIPTGSLFVSESVLKGVLPQVLDEMLSTRAMLKKAAKEYKKRVKNLSPAVLRQIEARQLALKYVANVTYGYTSATFSGRSAVPLVADAIVECGRRTLTNAIDLANRWGSDENGRWSGAHVLYGDTDSVFIKLPGRSIKEAFAFGEQFCKAVTYRNPPPVELKLEKVYSACLLQTKKKYCGMMYESPKQKHPTFEAKGIETVRRDQCTLTQRVLKDALVHVFQRGLGPAQKYLERQWALIHSGRLPVSDFVLTGRVRSRYRGGKVGPVQATLAKRLAEVDPGRVVRHKERLPYVIVAMPGRTFRLRDGVLTPLELLEQWDSYTINAEYYTIKHLNAALQRCFGLPPFNLSIEACYNSCPKTRRRIHHWPQSRSAASLMISSYFGSDVCALCSSKCKSSGNSKVVVCRRCKADNVAVASTAMERLKISQQRASRLAAVCAGCNGCTETLGTFAQEELHQSTKRMNSLGGPILHSRKGGRLSTPLANCVCTDCPITYLRHEARECEIEATELCQALDLY